jgi:hypothetical protein
MPRLGLILLWTAAALAAVAGPASADFGPLGPGLRALGKGGAFTAEADGPAAVYWNPAGTRAAGGLRITLSYGLLQRPDFGMREFGNTDRPFLGATFAPEDEAGKPGFFGVGLCVMKPFPRLDYRTAPTSVEISPGTSRMLSAVLRSDYIEILAGAGFRVLDFAAFEKSARFDLNLGLSAGLGLSDDSVYGHLYDAAGTSLLGAEHYAGTNILVPGGVGLTFGMETKAVRLALGLRVRGVMGLSETAVLTFASESAEFTTADLFMPPPMEGCAGLSVAFFERILYSVELAYCFFDAPDAFPNVVPQDYPVVKFGFEYRVPSQDKSTRLDLRCGFSQTLIDSDADPSIYTTDATGIYVGLSLLLGGPACFDFFFSYQIPGEGDVDESSYVASFSYRIKF